MSSFSRRDVFVDFRLGIFYPQCGMGLYGVGIDDRIDQASTGLQIAWRAVAAVFLILLLVAAGATIERAASRDSQELRGLAPSGFGELQRSTYAISETSGKTFQPKALVTLAGWQAVESPEMGIRFLVPPDWREVTRRAREVVFSIPSATLGPLTITVRSIDNTRGESEADVLWKRVIGSKSSLDSAVTDGLVELTGTWIVDGEAGESLFSNEPSSEGHYIAVDRGSTMLILYAQKQRFTADNEQLLTFLSTIEFLRSASNP